MKLAEGQEGGRGLDELANELLARLAELGAPEGTWLLQIEQARGYLQQIDQLLRDLKDAIIRAGDRERPR